MRPRISRIFSAPRTSECLPREGGPAPDGTAYRYGLPCAKMNANANRSAIGCQGSNSTTTAKNARIHWDSCQDAPDTPTILPTRDRRPQPGARGHRWGRRRAGRAGHPRTECPRLRHQPPNRPDSPPRSSCASTKTATDSSVPCRNSRQSSRASAPAAGIARLTGTPHAARVGLSTSRRSDTEQCGGTGPDPLGSPLAPPVRSPCPRPIRSRLTSSKGHRQGVLRPNCPPGMGPEACVIVAHDAETGEELVAPRLVPAAGEPGDET